jgi:hypothetical protein
MYVPIPSALRCAFSKSVLAGAFLLSIMSAPMGLAENLARQVAPSTLPDAALNEDESQPLTDAQQAAKQLAETLERERPAGAAAVSGPAAVPLTEPSLIYKRFMIKLYTTDRVEVVVMGGRPTLVSPVNSEAVDNVDAGRPTLLRTEEGAIAIGVSMD